jgi:putrescine transport system permease protein
VIASLNIGQARRPCRSRIYSEVRLGLKPEINAICTLIIGVIAVVIVAASLASKPSGARGETAALP